MPTVTVIQPTIAAEQNTMVLSISLDTFYSNKNYAARKI